MSPSFDTVGWLAATPGVFRKVGTVLLGGAPVAAPVNHLLIADDGFIEADDAVSSLLRDALVAMADVLPHPQHIQIAPNGLDPWRDAIRLLQAYEIWQVYGRFIEEKRPRFGPSVSERMQVAAKITKAEADAARQIHATARDHIHDKVKPGTIVALPTAPCIAPRTDTPADGLESYRVRVMRLTCIAGLAGLPQVTIPVGTVSGCPVGLSFIGWARGDEVLLDLAFELSRHLGINRADEVIE